MKAVLCEEYAPPVSLMVRDASALGVPCGASLRADPDHHAANVAGILGWLSAGQMRSAIDRIFPLKDGAAAIAHVLDRKAVSNVIIAVCSSTGTAQGDEAR